MTLNEYQQEVLRTENRPNKPVIHSLFTLMNRLKREAVWSPALEDLMNEIIADVRQMHHERYLMLHALGLAGEAGEVADLVKKEVGHGHQIPVDKYRRELGDVDWYRNALAYRKGLEAEDIGQTNVIKLRQRYPDGFDPIRSQNRDAEPKE